MRMTFERDTCEPPVIGSGGYFTRWRFKWHNSPCEDKSWGFNYGFILQGTASRHRLGLFTAGDLLLKAVCYVLIKHSLHARSPTRINDTNTWSGKTRLTQPFNSDPADVTRLRRLWLCSDLPLHFFCAFLLCFLQTAGWKACIWSPCVWKRRVVVLIVVMLCGGGRLISETNQNDVLRWTVIQFNYLIVDPLIIEGEQPFMLNWRSDDVLSLDPQQCWRIA